MAYIYKITNDVNGKIYIGKTEFSIEKRFKEHCHDSVSRAKEKRPLYAAMRKYGTEHFHVELVEETDNPNEREIYWIQYYRSFKYGYNATLGGEGTRYIDYDLVLETYNQTRSMRDTAKILNISADSVSLILHELNANILTSQEIAKEKYGKITSMYDLQGNYLRTFGSLNEAARYMVDNKLTGCKLTTIKQHIAEACTGRRKTAAKFIWKYNSAE